MPSCYYYDEQRNRCNCYVNENLNELLAENAKLQASNEVIAEDHAALCEQNAKLRELVADFDKCLDTALYLAGEAGYLTMPDQKLFASLRPRMRELGVEVD